MNTLLALLGSELIVKLGLWFLESVAEKQAIDKDSKRLFIEMAKKFRESGISSAKSRFEAEDQIQSGNDQWDEREKSQSEKK